MVNDEHLQFVELVKRLREKARQHGDRPLAEALSHCAWKVLSGNESCPMGRFILEDRKLGASSPGMSLEAAAGFLTEQTGPTKVLHEPLDRDELIKHILSLLTKKATLRKDAPFLRVLQECGEFIESRETCPLHRLLRSEKPPSTSSGSSCK